MEVRPSGQACGARVTGVDLTAPLDADTVATLRRAWLEHHVLAFPEQPMTDDDLERFTLAFGGFGEDPFIAPIAGREHVIAIKRTAHETAPLFAENWHTDWSFQARPPAGTCLFGITIPPHGGDTLYADQHRALEAMPASLRSRLDGRLAIHSARGGYAPSGTYGTADQTTDRSMDIRPSDAAMATQLHPIVRAHPETGRLGLFGCIGYVIGIDGMAEEEARPAAHRVVRVADPRGVLVPPPLGAADAGAVGQPLGAAQGHRRLRGPRSPVAPHHHRRRAWFSRRRGNRCGRSIAARRRTWGMERLPPGTTSTRLTMRLWRVDEAPVSAPR